MSSRLNNTARNIKWGVIGQVLTIVFNFASRTVFLYCFSKEYVGVGSLFLGIFSVLSLADLGMETSMTVHLYKPLADKNKTLILSYLQFYKKTYYYIAAVITGLGLLLLPFIDEIVDIPSGVEDVQWIYILSLANTTVSYLFIYRKILLVADQKKYLTDILQYVRMISQFAVMIPILLLTKNYLMYLGIQIFFTILYNFVVMYKSKKVYPYIDNECTPLDYENRKIIKRDMVALSLHRIGDVVNQNAVTLLTGSFISVIAVAIFSNYQILITNVKTLMDKVYYSISPSVGNLAAEGIIEKAHSVLMKFFFASFWLACFTATCLFCLLNPFIELWIGESYLFDMQLVALIVVSFIIVNMRKPALIFKEAYGFFANDQWRPLVESAINVTVSIVLVKSFNLGLRGIFIGGIVASITTSWWIEPYILYSKGFNMSCKRYFIKYIEYVFVIILALSLTYLACSQLPNGVIAFIVRIAICLIIPNLVVIFIYHRNDNFKWMVGLVKNRINRHKK